MFSVNTASLNPNCELNLFISFVLAHSLYYDIDVIDESVHVEIDSNSL